MPASYPTSAKTFTTKNTTDTIQAAHVNDPQAEITAIEQDLIAGLPVSRGGTGLTAIGAVGTVLTSDGSAASWAVHGLTQSFRSLTLRTHPDADVAAYKVYLDHADEIIMHDGTRVADWDDLTADITASGANGLDTGAEAASTWYQVLAIRKSSDGTKGLLLHRAKDYTADASYTTARDAGAVLRYDANSQKVAQGVTTVAGGALQFVDMQAYKVGSPTGVIYLTIEADSSGSPSGTPLATSDKIDVSLLTTTNTQWIRFVFRSPVTLAATTVYHVVINSTVATSISNYLNASGTTANGYAGGSAKQYNGSAWSAIGNPADLVFRAYVTQNDTAVTMPSGYDQRALIGWVYSDSGSDFDPFTAMDRDIAYSGPISIGTTTATIMTLTDLSSVLPPQTVRGRFAASAAADDTATSVGPVPDGYGGVAVQVLRTAGTSAGSQQGQFAPIVTEQQGVYWKVNTSTGTLWVTGYRW